MVLSFLAYQISFVIFALSTAWPAFAAAMFCFAVGESFRSGTHKAMIFDWLAAQGREITEGRQQRSDQPRRHRPQEQDQRQARRVTDKLGSPSAGVSCHSA